MQFDPNIAIWVQLVTEFKRRIVTNEWPPGHKVPSVRELAEDVQVNPNTVQKALAELERDNLCNSKRTAGRFVTEDIAHITVLRKQLANEMVTEFITQLKGLHIDLASANDLLAEFWDTTTSHVLHPPTNQADSIKTAKSTTQTTKHVDTTKPTTHPTENVETTHPKDKP